MVTTVNPPTRCEFSDCRKKLSSVTTVQCRCEKFFCAEHRNGFAHQCSVDVVKIHKDRLIVNNPLVNTEKFQRID